MSLLRNRKMLKWDSNHLARISDNTVTKRSQRRTKSGPTTFVADELRPEETLVGDVGSSSMRGISVAVRPWMTCSLEDLLDMDTSLSKYVTAVKLVSSAMSAEDITVVGSTKDICE